MEQESYAYQKIFQGEAYMTLKRISVVILSSLLYFSCGESQVNTVEFFNKKNSVNIKSHEIEKAFDSSSIADGETVYVPIYSSVYFKDSTSLYNLTATLNIRNVDRDGELYLQEIDYYNSKGELVKKFLNKILKVKPLETFDLVIAESDISGGTGSSFIVKWVAKKNIQSPVVEAVMISTRQGVGLSFITNGKVIQTYTGHAADVPSDGNMQHGTADK
ncbi:MAG TPA: DUF3124 domain-containing protein [Spirochaetota bacterium]|jgi:hypothetical protein|nr:DUF3124 domain-containing protein [Spirochaetota bacterium]HPS86709.1 DUF3124 domain-containing protein [Spirochaetota bacterium]